MVDAMGRDRERDGRPWQERWFVIARAMVGHGKGHGS
jgi:hypothetical protein